MAKFEAMSRNVIPKDKYELVKVVDDAASVLLYIEGAGGDVFEISFRSPLMYCKMNESYALLTLEEVPGDVASGGVLYRVSGSDFVDYFNRQSCGVYNNSKFGHYVIFTCDDVVHVISWDEPGIKKVIISPVSP